MNTRDIMYYRGSYYRRYHRTVPFTSDAQGETGQETVPARHTALWGYSDRFQAMHTVSHNFRRVSGR